MFVSAGSVITTATCWSASAASTVASSFHSMARVVCAGGTAGATLPARSRVAPSGVWRRAGVKGPS